MDSFGTLAPDKAFRRRSGPPAPGERLDPHYQRANQFVFLGHAESVKIGQDIHASLYPTFLPLPQYTTATSI
jgi:hypothetical protein